MNPTLWEVEHRLFVFGSLMDSDVLELVSGMSISDLFVAKASAAGYRQCEVREESYPVLVADDTGECHGLLIRGLTSLAVERVLFFEGEEYTLKPITVVSEDVVSEDMVGEDSAREDADDTKSVNAYYFSDTGAYTVNTESWDYADWQRHHKSSFVTASAAYMKLFGEMTAAEADAHWLELADRAATLKTTDSGLNRHPDKLAS